MTTLIGYWQMAVIYSKLKQQTETALPQKMVPLLSYAKLFRYLTAA